MDAAVTSLGNEWEYDYELQVYSSGHEEYYDEAALQPRFTESDRADILSRPMWRAWIAHRGRRATWCWTR